MTQQRALNTRVRLLDAAATEFTQHGYAGGSVNRMLDVAACTKGAMYFHFASKRALAEAVLDAAEQAYSAVEQRRPTTGDVHPIEAIAHMVDDAADLYEHDLRVQAASRLTLEPDFVDRDPTKRWVDAVAGLAARLAESDCLINDFTADKFAGTLATMLAGNRYLAGHRADRRHRVDPEPIQRVSRYRAHRGGIAAIARVADTSRGGGH